MKLSIFFLFSFPGKRKAERSKEKRKEKANEKRKR